MAYFYTSHFHNGWYDTQFRMPIAGPRPYPYHTSSFPILPYGTWINTPQLHERPPPTNKLQTPKPNSTPFTSPSTRKPATAAPIKLPLRSILKSPRPGPVQPRRKKSVHFTLSTGSPPLAAPGTYKHTGKPRPEKARHPARFHSCLTSTLQPRAVPMNSGPPRPTTSQPAKPQSNTSNSTRQRPAERNSRPPTPPPADFFQGPKKVQMGLQNTQRATHQPITSAPRPAATAAAARLRIPVRKGRAQSHVQTPAPVQIVAYAGPYDSDSEDSNTDIRLAKHVAVKKTGFKILEARTTLEARARKVEAAAMRRSLRVLAREFDRKNAWRRKGWEAG